MHKLRVGYEHVNWAFLPEECGMFEENYFMISIISPMTFYLIWSKLHFYNIMLHLHHIRDKTQEWSVELEK